MILDEVREKVRLKYESVANNPKSSKETKKYTEILVRVFDDVDAIIKSPESLIDEALFFIGYDYDSIDEIYNGLITELTEVYKLVDPEFLTININKEKKTK